MKYVVEVREPVPSSLDAVASKVAASFKISDAKAMALLRRAPGAMTKPVSEREADVVVGIFERAGLNVVKRPAEEEGAPAVQEQAGARHEPNSRPRPEQPAQAEPERAEPEPEPAEPEPDAGARQAPAGTERAGEAVWDQPLSAGGAEPVDGFSRREDFEERADDIGWEGGGWGAPTEDADAFRAGSGRGAGASGAAAVGAAGWDAAVAKEDYEPGRGEPEAGAIDVDTAGGAETGAESGAETGAEAGSAAGAPRRGAFAGEAGAARPDEVPEVGEVPQADEGAVVEPDDEVEDGEGEEAPGAGRRRRRRGPARRRPERPPREPRRRQVAGRSGERGAEDAQLGRGGIRRAVTWTGVLPPLLAWLAMGVAMLVMVAPVAGEQQTSRAADAAAAQAATLGALTGGLPLTAQTLSSPLVDLAAKSQALLLPRGVSLMVVTDAHGAPLAGWYGAAETPAALPPETRRAVSDRAAAAVAGRPPASPFGGRLREAWNVLQAMLGGAGQSTVLRASPVTSGGQAVGAVVVGVPPVAAGGSLLQAFEVVLLVGLVPLVIGILMASSLNDGLRRRVQYLLQAADRISHGDLDEPVSLRGRDEMGQLARAIERIRVSVSTLLQYRRRHR